MTVKTSSQKTGAVWHFDTIMIIAKQRYPKNSTFATFSITYHPHHAPHNHDVDHHADHDHTDHDHADHDHADHDDVQGVCGEEAGSAVVCGPTQVKNKKVKMMFKVSYIIISLMIIIIIINIVNIVTVICNPI